SFEGSGYKEIKELSDTLNFASSELSKVDDLRKELIANISHDLRTPLTLIGGYAEAMRDLPDENNAENAQIIIDETTRLTTLVNNVLDLSKIQSGMQKFNLASFNLTDSIEHVINRVNELVKVEGYTISFIYDSNVIITADETRITQALYNLLVNAINYSGDDKTVVVKQLTSDHKVKIEVIDNGEGIPSEKLPYIWDRYFKSDEAHKRAVTGSGIGLSIVKSIIEMHEGEYGVNSSLNEGSVFWFKLKR
ncbi:MAG: HAMP domain-containing sensor histidine kinase, partial [Eubacteriales bacterium]